MYEEIHARARDLLPLKTLLVDQLNDDPDYTGLYLTKGLVVLFLSETEGYFLQ